MSPTRVLFVGADPTGGTFEIPTELERIRSVVEREPAPFELHHDLDLTARELQELLNRVRPEVFHFSGHIDEQASIALVDDHGEARMVGKDVLLQVMRHHAPSIRCAFLNACNGDTLGRELADVVGVTVAMEGMVLVPTALVFAERFYDALAAGRSVREAFEQGKLELQLLDVEGHERPLLFEREAGLAASLVLGGGPAPGLAVPPAAASAPGPAPTPGTTTGPGATGPGAAGAGDIFISYAHEDEAWLEKVTTMLKPIVRNHGIVAWDDRTIAPSDDWAERIREALSRARTAILLVSSDFLASDFIVEKELPHIVEAWKAGRMKVLWVYLSPCLYDEAGLDPIQAAHKPLEPLIGMDGAGQYRALHQVALAIREELTGGA